MSPDAYDEVVVVRVVVADDNPVVRLGLISLLESTGRVDVVGTAGDGRTAISLVEDLAPDVLLLDMRMPLLDGMATIQLLGNRLPVLMLSHEDAPDLVAKALAFGATGYLVHGFFGADELVRAVLGTAAGEAHLSPPAAAAVLQAVRRGTEAASTLPSPPCDVGGVPISSATAGAPARPGAGAPAARDMSEREADVMALVAQGLTNREIASRLFLAEKTVKNHLNRIFAKMHAGSRGEAIARWLGNVPDAM